MGKVEEDLRARLRGSALALFQERGYDRTTAAQIAKRTGVTERTFFRYFPDKREVLFDGEPLVRDVLTAAVADAPVDLNPLDTLFSAFRAFEQHLENNRGYSKPRQDIISITPALQERELAKIDALTDALATALRARGVSDLRASLAARAGMAAFVQATLAWLADPEISFSKRLEHSARELKAVLSSGGGCAD